jgi:hypothetical protein
MNRWNDHAKHIREMRAEAYQDFLVQTHHLMVLRGKALSGRIGVDDKAQEKLDAHRTSGTAIQLLSTDPRLIALVEDMVKGAGADINAALNKADGDRAVTGDHFTQLMIAMRRELGVPTRQHGFASKMRLRRRPK